MPPLRSVHSAITESQPALDAMGLEFPAGPRNVTLRGQRTSIRIRDSEWEAVLEIASREGRTVSEIIEEIDRRRGDACLAAAIRVFAIAYFRALLLKMEETDGRIVRPPILLATRQMFTLCSDYEAGYHT